MYEKLFMCGTMELYGPIFWINVLLTAIIPGLLATWLGVGGCFLRIPMLIYLFGVNIKTAYCINQAVVAVTTLPGVYVHWRKGHVYSKGLITAILGAIIGVSLGAYVVARYIPTTMLKGIFGFACIIIGIYVAYRTIKARRALMRRITVKEVKELEHGLKLFILMFLAGFATGLCGFGGGIYFVPLFIALGYPTHIAVGTSSSEMIATAGMGSAVLTSMGFMNLILFLAVGIPTLIASYIGAKLAVKSPPWLLRLIYAIAIIFAGAYVAYDAITKII